MSGKDKDNSGFDDFEFPEFGEAETHHAGSAHHGAASAPHHAAGHGGFDEENFDTPSASGGDDDFEFETAPEPPRARPAASHAHDGHDQGGDAFGEIPDGGDEHGFDEHEAHDVGHHDEAGDAVGDAYDPPQPKGKSLLSKLVIPVGGVALAAVAGVGAWSAGMFGSTAAPTPAPDPRLAPAARPQPAPNAMPNQPRIPASPPAGLQPAPSLPPAPSMAPATTQPMPSMPNPVPQPQAQASNPGMEAALKDLVTATTNLNKTLDTRFASFDDKLTNMVGAVNDRLAVTDGKIGEVGTRVASVEARVAALEQGRGAKPASPAPLPKVGPAPSAPMPVPPQAPRERREPEPHARIHREAAQGLRGFALRGVAKGANPDSAWVQTPGGFFMVGVGQELNGAGRIREIRREGSSWAIVTTEGVIRP